MKFTHLFHVNKSFPAWKIIYKNYGQCSNFPCALFLVHMHCVCAVCIIFCGVVQCCISRVGWGLECEGRACEGARLGSVPSRPHTRDQVTVRSAHHLRNLTTLLILKRVHVNDPLSTRKRTILFRQRLKFNSKKPPSTAVCPTQVMNLTGFNFIWPALEAPRTKFQQQTRGNFVLDEKRLGIGTVF